eukprot:CAMPEP_0197538492 /NCGR_PEP_ID=MMETSP1318-20131121/59855_1 /TAXON_ID=552666 /ORGANISM="Partenskyella glossopodia, Strain RCC365" /LENGTH=158 /DNA_ID=CAMNT_0043096929 /DNA_START=169 /DNA_END=645 /DNA_ORIENTATION=-
MAALIRDISNNQPYKLIKPLVASWLRTLDTIMLAKSSPARCKLNCAALCLFLGLMGNDFDCLQTYAKPILRATSAVVHRLEAEAARTAASRDDDIDDYQANKTLGTEERKRRKALEAKDPCKAIDLSQYFVSALRKAEAAVGQNYKAKFAMLLKTLGL